MDDKLIRIEDRLERHSEILSNINGNLQEHMRRTQIAEENIEKLSNAMAPVQEHVALIRASGKILTAAVAVVGLATAIWQLLK